MYVYKLHTSSSLYWDRIIMCKSYGQRSGESIGKCVQNITSFKLLHPHFRFTMARARATLDLIHDGGILDILFGIGGAGRVELMKRGYKSYKRI